MDFMDGKWTVAEILVVVLVLLFLFWNPATRSVILFILPLGSGVDDLIFIVLAVIAATLGLVSLIKKRRER